MEKRGIRTERGDLNRESRANPKERYQYLASGTAGAAAPQGAGYGAVTDRAAVLKSVVSKPPFGVRFRLGRVNRTAAHPTVFLYAVSVGGWGIIFENTLSVCF